MNLSKTWPLDSDGRFGKKTSAAASEIITVDPVATAFKFFRALGRSGEMSEARSKYGPVYMRVFDDGSRIVYRPHTKSSTKSGVENPSVGIEVRSINSPYPGGYRIHFKRKDQKK